MEEMKDGATNLVTITGLASLLMEWESVLTVLLILTGVILNGMRIYDWFKGKGKD